MDTDPWNRTYATPMTSAKTHRRPPKGPPAVPFRVVAWAGGTVLVGAGL